MLNQKLQLKLSQKLSPQQIQLMKLIQLSTLEFEQRLSTEIEENPALDTINENQEKENDDFELEDNFENEDVIMMRLIYPIIYLMMIYLNII